MLFFWGGFDSYQAKVMGKSPMKILLKGSCVAKDLRVPWISHFATAFGLQIWKCTTRCSPSRGAKPCLLHVPKVKTKANLRPPTPTHPPLHSPIQTQRHKDTQTHGDTDTQRHAERDGERERDTRTQTHKQIFRLSVLNSKGEEPTFARRATGWYNLTIPP